MKRNEGSGTTPPVPEQPPEGADEPECADEHQEDGFTGDDEAEFDVESEQFDPAFHRPRSPRIPRRWDRS